MFDAIFANRTARFILPVVSIMAVAAMGAGMLHATHALDMAPENFRPALSNVNSLPASGTTGAYTITVDTAIISDTPDRHVAATVTERNATQSEAQVSPGLQMSVVDAAGGIHPYTAVYVPVGSIVGGALGAGASRTETLDFGLGASDQPKLFVFQADASSGPLILRLPL